MTTQKEEIEEHHHERVNQILGDLAEEYGRWYGWNDPSRFGRSLAIGECILEQTASEDPHDPWQTEARNAYLKWQKTHNQSPYPPVNLATK